ncbi:hypothetical protein [Pedococcus bigeumensis]|uniref:Uncharacterized protein n=1 Tax=Pedococcus bigeumensis TaxID=433644 RepID=A0A502D0N5_9MICO|nr:hypothetical protein [Pedococcus bigeumensis]TPG19355.1 hypothetical protein EAH86_02345 [Pedococcus bigeumensis]
MAGKHARRAPVVISRAVATLVVSALLLAVGVAAMTVFKSGDRPATGRPRAGGPTVTTGPSAAPTPTTGATSGAEQGDGATGDAEPGGASSGGSSAAGGGDFLDFTSTGGSGTTPAGMPPGSASSAAAATLPGVAPEVAAWSRGWVQRSDTGRSHGRSLGLLRRLAAAHGCRPVPTKAKPVTALPEPVACR